MYGLTWCICAFAPGENNSASDDSTPAHIKLFIDHFITITWLTYRKNFPPIEGTRITTDCGWGCMVRSGQMLLATALNYHLLGRGVILCFFFDLNVSHFVMCTEWRLATSDKKQRMLHRQVRLWCHTQVHHRFCNYLTKCKMVLQIYNNYCKMPP